MGVMKSLKESVWPTGKKNLGSPVYVEEDGPILGIVDDVFVDRSSGKPLAYKILASGQYLELPAEAVSETPGGYIYRSPWFAEADALLRKLEGQNLVMPELFFSTPATASSDRRLLESAMQRSPALKKLVDEAKDLHKDLLPRLESMEQEKARLVGQIADLTEGMASGRIDKESYREGFVALKRRLQVLDASVRRGESLRSRLEGVPFVRLSLNGHASHAREPTNGHTPAFTGTPVAPGARPEEWRRVKKLRVLRSEKEIREKEEHLAKMEKELEHFGLPLDQAVQALASDFATLSEASERGPEALKAELRRRLEVVRPSPAPSAAAKSSKSLPDLPSENPKATCAFCGEPLKGGEPTCPACHADLAHMERAKEGAGAPSKTDVFFKGGGATKTGVVLLVIGAALFLLSHFLH